MSSFGLGVLGVLGGESQNTARGLGNTGVQGTMIYVPNGKGCWLHLVKFEYASYQKYIFCENIPCLKCLYDTFQE